MDPDWSMQMVNSFWMPRWRRPCPMSLSGTTVPSSGT